MSLHVDEEGYVGPFAARSHRVIGVGDLPLATDEVASAAPLDQLFRGAESVDIVAPSSTDGARIVVREPVKKGVSPANRREQTIIERVGDRDFFLDEGGFWQVHRSAAELSDRPGPVDHRRGAVRPARRESRPLRWCRPPCRCRRRPVRGQNADHDRRSRRAATDHAAENLREWVGASTVTARVDPYLRDLVSQSSGEGLRLAAATVVLDPPRSGAGGGRR